MKRKRSNGSVRSSHDAKASGDAADTPRVDMLKELDRETAYVRENDRRSTRARASREAARLDEELAKAHANDPDFLHWDRNRSFNRQDFDYLHYHRQNFSPKVQQQLEIIGSKITHVCADDEDGYFNKLERNIGWTPHITPLVFTGFAVVDNVVRCGLWANAKNSRRCHKPDLCPLCLWNDYLKAQVYAFGASSPAFYGALVWLFFTLSFTTNPDNSKCAFKLATDEDFKVERGEFNREGVYAGVHDQHPVSMGDDMGDLACYGMTEARILWLITQEAITSLYPELLDGYHTKLEGAFSIIPGSGIRLLPHAHGTANASREADGHYIAQRMFEGMQAGLKKYRRHLSRKYYPDVKVFQLAEAEHLERCLVYTEKVVPVGRIVAEAMNLPAARNPDGRWNTVYTANLEHLLSSLVDDLTESLFRGFRLYKKLITLRRRKTAGNMVFTDRGTCIGTEPEWHVRARHNRAKKAREARQRKKEQEVMLQPDRPKRASKKRRARRSTRGRPAGGPSKPRRQSRTGGPVHQARQASNHCFPSV